MIYHSLNEFLSAIFYFSIYGIITSGIYISQDVLISWIKRFIKIPVIAFENHKIFSNKKRKKSLLLRYHITDFILFTLFGIGYIVLQYISLDGAFRIFFLLIFLFSFYLSQSSIGRLIKIALNFILKLLYEMIFRFYNFVVFPIRFIIKLLVKLFIPIGKAIKGYIKIFRKRQISKKNTRILNKIVKKI